MIVDLVRNRKWLAGIGAAVGSYLFQAIALATGPLSLVQPLVVSELLFAVPISARRHRSRLGPREWAGLLTVTAGLVVGIVAADPHRGNPIQPFSSWIWPLVAVAGIVLLVIGIVMLDTSPVIRRHQREESKQRGDAAPSSTRATAPASGAS